MILGMISAARAQQSMVSDDRAASRIAWWRDAKFGLFMHWGVYSILGRGEWVQWNEQISVTEYAKLAAQFHPDKFDPDAWAAIAKAAGMKYTVLTARHHDGFALFDDPGSDFTAMKSAAHRDFVADYVNAVRKAGLRVGLYYSPLDWRFPGFFFPDLYRAKRRGDARAVSSPTQRPGLSLRQNRHPLVRRRRRRLAGVRRRRLQRRMERAAQGSALLRFVLLAGRSSGRQSQEASAVDHH